MDKIIIEKKEGKKKDRRATVVIKPETYAEVYNLSLQTNQPIETIVDLLLHEALKYVEIRESEVE